MNYSKLRGICQLCGRKISCFDANNFHAAHGSSRDKPSMCKGKILWYLSPPQLNVLSHSDEFVEYCRFGHGDPSFLSNFLWWVQTKLEHEPLFIAQILRRSEILRDTKEEEK